MRATAVLAALLSLAALSAQAAPPQISYYGPSSGPPGTVVHISGLYFTGTTSVTFSDLPAEFTVQSDTLIYATVPGSAVSGNFFVTTPEGVSNAGYFEIAHPRPLIESVTPDEGPAEGGQGVVITGSHFLPGIEVAFGGVPAVSVTFANSTRLEVVTPAHAPAHVGVEVRNPEGIATVLEFAYRYLDCVLPRITAGPEEVGVLRGASATLEVSADDEGPLAYQWYVQASGDWQEIEGATSPSLDITPAEATQYQLRITNGCGTAAHTVLVNVCGAAVATAQQPRLNAGQKTSLTVAVDAPAVHAVQWYELRNGALVSIAGATGATYHTSVLQATTVYVARVTTPCGTIDSAPVVVTVGDAKRRAVRK